VNKEQILAAISTVAEIYAWVPAIGVFVRVDKDALVRTINEQDGKVYRAELVGTEMLKIG